MVSACPRSGTGYMATLLQTMGVRCGHENVFGPNEALNGGHPTWDRYQGDSSWMAIVSVLTGDEIILHQTRHPLAVVRSLVGIGLLRDEAASTYTDVVRSRVPEVFALSGEAQRAAALWKVWNEMIEERATLRYRVEDAAEAIPLVCDSLGIKMRRRRIDEALKGVSRTTNSRARDESIRWEGIAEIVGELAARYGYDAQRTTG